MFKKNKPSWQKRLLFDKEAARQKRLDGKLEHVIINEKRPKSIKKFLVDQVPFEYQTKEQFDFCMSQPIGQEWTGIRSYKNNIKPSVVTNKGVSIVPISKTKTPKTKFL